METKHETPKMKIELEAARHFLTSAFIGACWHLMNDYSNGVEDMTFYTMEDSEVQEWIESILVKGNNMSYTSTWEGDKQIISPCLR
jgi:hypothetical protein